MPFGRRRNMDQRVSQVLSRLGGVYRDPARVDRDASTLLRSSVGSHLHPIAAPIILSEGYQPTLTNQSVLVLQGTIAMHFRGKTYQILVDIYLGSSYPRSPPTCYVRLAENMFFKENHRHVGLDGRVYLPYLSEWSPDTHNLVELVVAMSSVFSADPPVFSRAAAAVPLTQLPNQGVGTSHHSASGSVSSATYSASSSNGPLRQSQQQHHLEQQYQREQQRLAEERTAREVAEANAAAEAARRAENEERERRAQIEAQIAYEAARCRSLRQDVQDKIMRYLSETTEQCRLNLQDDVRDQDRLAVATQKLETQSEFFERRREELERYVKVVEERTVDIENLLKVCEESKNNDQSPKSVDDMVRPISALHGQMLDLSAENAAIGDALYFLDRALYVGNLDCASHQRQVRRLAKRQFLVRAHLMKIQQVILNRGTQANRVNGRRY